MAYTRVARGHGSAGLSTTDPLTEMRRLISGEDDLLRVEEYRQDGALVLRVEAPGVDPERDVDIKIEDDLLTVAVERREEMTEGAEGRADYRSEFRYGSFNRSMRLPRGIEEDDISASYADGILTVRIPFPEEQPPGSRRVPVQRS